MSLEPIYYAYCNCHAVLKTLDNNFEDALKGILEDGWEYKDGQAICPDCVAKNNKEK